MKGRGAFMNPDPSHRPRTARSRGFLIGRIHVEPPSPENQVHGCRTTFIEQTKPNLSCKSWRLGNEFYCVPFPFRLDCRHPLSCPPPERCSDVFSSARSRACLHSGVASCHQHCELISGHLREILEKSQQSIRRALNAGGKPGLASDGARGQSISQSRTEVLQ